MAYYSRDNCVSSGDQSGCSTDYSLSDVKQLVDVWKANYANGATEARLITIDDLEDNLGYNQANWNASYWVVNPEYTPSWVYNSKYWTSTQYNDEASSVWNVANGGNLQSITVCGSGGYIDVSVRPVITLSKTNISS